QNGIHHNIGARDAQLREETLHALARLTGQNPADDIFGSRWILTDNENSGGAIEPASVVHGPPFEAEPFRYPLVLGEGRLFEDGPQGGRRPRIPFHHSQTPLQGSDSATVAQLAL